MDNSSEKNFLQQSVPKSRIIILIKILVILVPVIAIYWQELDLAFRAAVSNDFLSYILILPFIIAYTVYRKRKMLSAVASLNETRQGKVTWIGQIVIGVTLLTASFLAYFFGSYTSSALEYHLLSFPLFLAASIVLVFNLQTLKTLLFPVSLLFFIQPYLVRLVSPFWSDLSWICSTLAYNLLRGIGIPATFTTVLEVPTIEIVTKDGSTWPFTVGVASSGLNSLIGFTLFSIVVVYILREPLWKRISLMLVGYPLLMLLNTLRITIVLSLAYGWNLDIAEVFHQTGGIVLIFVGTLLLLFIGEKIWRVKVFSVRPLSSFCSNCSESLQRGSNFCMSCGKLLRSINPIVSRQGALKIALLILVVILFLLIQTPPLVSGKSPTEIDLTAISPDESKQLLPKIDGWQLQFLYRDRRVESILRQDAALLFSYRTQDVQENAAYAYIFVAVQISTGWHTWEASLITWPARYGLPSATVLDLRDVQILHDPTLTARFFAYQRPGSNLTEVVLYWFERVPFRVRSIWDLRNVQITLQVYSDELTYSGLISNSSDLAGVERVYMPIAQSIAEYWQPVKASSYVSALISTHGDKILIATLGLVTGTNVTYVLTKRREKSANTNAYLKLSQPDKDLVGIIHETEKTEKPTVDAIATRYDAAIKQPVDKKRLFQKLVEAEKIGVIRSSITSQLDEPVQIWKTQIHFKKGPSKHN